MWQSALKALSIPDWLIIVVVHDENKVKTKILRTSVYDKVKSDFGSKSSGRLVVFLSTPEAFVVPSRSALLFRGMINWLSSDRNGKFQAPSWSAVYKI